eukprot:gene13479-biopygen46217
MNTGWGAPASRAVDGVRHQPGDTGGIATSGVPREGITNPWWQVHLDAEYRIGLVLITNRLVGGGQGRLDGFEVRVGNDATGDRSNNHNCGNGGHGRVRLGATVDVDCAGHRGRYVYVRIPGDRKTLTLCEVEVYELLTPTIPPYEHGTPSRQPASTAPATPTAVQ